MALAVASSTVSIATASATATLIPYPSSIAAGDVLVLFYATKPYSATPTTPAGWTKLIERTNGTTAQSTDTGSMKIAVYSRKADGTETGSLTMVNASGNSSWGVMYRVTKAANMDVAFASTSGVDNTANTALAVNFDDQIALAPGDLVLVGIGWPTDTARTVSASAISATGTTWTGVVAAGDKNPRITTGNDTGGNTNHASVNTGTVTQYPSWNATLSVATGATGAAVLARLREFPPVEIDGSITATATITAEASVTPGAGVGGGSQFQLRSGTAQLRAGHYVRGVAGASAASITASDSGRGGEARVLATAVVKTSSDTGRGSESRAPVARATVRADAGRSADASTITRRGGTLYKTLHKAIGHAPASRADWVTTFSPNTAAEGWHRGDGALSIPGTGWRAFCFNDFFVSDGGGGDSVYAIFRRNSVLWANTANGDVYWLSSGDGFPMAGSVTFPYDDVTATGWSWLDGGWQVATNDLILLAGIWESGTPYYQTQFRVMKVSGLDTSAPVYSPTYACGIDLAAAGTPDWRGMPFVDGGYVYLYGVGADWAMHLTRHAVDANPANYATGWEYWTGSGWSTNSALSAGVTVASAPLRALDVIPWQGRYLACAKDFDSGPEGAAGPTDYTQAKAWVADAVTGPWAYLGVVKDTAVANWWSYAARLEVLPGTSDLSIVWSVNTTEANGFTADTYGPQIALPTQVNLPNGTDAGRGRELPPAKTWTPPSLDTARFAESRTLVQARTLVANDAGRSADASSLSSATAKSGSDAGRGAEAAAPLGQGRSSADAGHLGEARVLATATSFTAADAGHGVEVARQVTETRSITSADAGRGGESRAPAGRATDRADTGAGREVASALTSATWVSADAARFFEDTVLAVGNNLARAGVDAGRLLETATVVVTARFIGSADTARGAESPPEGLELSGRSDVGAGRESAAGVNAGAAAADFAASAETAGITALGWFASDRAALGETVVVEHTSQGQLDRLETAHLAETVALDRVFSSADGGRGVDGHDPVALDLAGTDTGGAGEASPSRAFAGADRSPLIEAALVETLGALALTRSETPRVLEAAVVEVTVVRVDAGRAQDGPTGRQEGRERYDAATVTERSTTGARAYQGADGGRLGELAQIVATFASRDAGRSSEGRAGTIPAEIGAGDRAGLAELARIGAALAAMVELVRINQVGLVEGGGQLAGVDRTRVLERARVDVNKHPGRVRNTTTPRGKAAVNTTAPRKGIVDTTKPRRSLGGARQ
jgi:hypothetical protein